MGLVALLLILALIFGGLGLFVEGLKWLLIIALVLFVVSFFTGSRGVAASSDLLRRSQPFATDGGPEGPPSARSRPVRSRRSRWCSIARTASCLGLRRER